jgi:hypothetical protein
MTGGHAPGVRVYLGSGVLQSAVADFFAQKKPVGDFGTDPTDTDFRRIEIAVRQRHGDR